MHVEGKKGRLESGTPCELFVVELEGLEPSSKRGIDEFSTCLVSDWFSCGGRAETPNRSLSSLNFGIESELLASYTRFSCTAMSRSLGSRTLGRCLVHVTVTRIKLIYCTSIKQRERSCFRHLNF